VWLILLFVVASLVPGLFWAPAQASLSQVGAAAVPAPKAPPRSAGYGLGALVVTNSAGWRPILPRADARGVLVLVAEPGTPLAAAYVRRGDIIVAIDQEEVPNSDTFSLFLQRATQPIHVLSVVSPQGDVRSVTATMTTRKISMAPYIASLDATKRDPVAQFLVAGSAGNIDRATNASKALVQENPDFGFGYILRARRSLDVLRLAGAKVVPTDAASSVTNDLAKAVEVAPEEPDVLIGAAEVLLVLGDFASAEMHAQKATLLDPGSSHAHEALGNARVALGRPQEALRDLRVAVDLNPYSPELYSALSKAYSKTGDRTAAASTDAVARQLAGRVSVPTSNAQTGVALSVFAIMVGAALAMLFLGGRPADIIERGQLWSRIAELVGDQQVPVMEIVGLVGLWAVAIPLLAGVFGVTRVSNLQPEIVNFVIPGCVLALVGAVGVMQWFRGRPGDRRTLTVYATIGFGCATWMLVRQGGTLIRAVQGRQAIGTLLLYASAGVAAMTVSAYVLWISTRQGRTTANG
jgi:tetratricopeptide (TPR) repeat protein